MIRSWPRTYAPSRWRGLAQDAVPRGPLAGRDEAHAPGPCAVALQDHQGAQERDEEEGAQEADDHAGDPREDPADEPSWPRIVSIDAGAAREAELGEERVHVPPRATR